ncbi:MAG TPA: TIGR03435 family protein, partial [Candidatus Solibacter sp.]
MIRRLALFPLLLVLLAAQAPEWQEFSLGPPRGKLEIGTNNIRQGVFHSNSISLKSLIALATGVTALHVIGPGWIESEHYGISATLSEASRLRLRTRSPDDARVVDEFRLLLTQELVQRFRLEFHRETRDTVEYTLQPADGETVTLRSAMPRERERITFSDTALTHNSTLDAHGVTMRTLGSWLRGHLKAPVTVTAAFPEGTFDFQLSWKSEDDASLIAALKNQLGAELVKKTERQEYLMVDRVEKPRDPAAPETTAPPESATAAPDSSVTYTPAQLRRDLRVLRDALEEGHPGIYRFVPKPELDRTFLRADAQLVHPMTALQFYRLLAPVVAGIKCGHTALRPSGAIQQRLAAEPLIPLETAILDGKVYVAQDFSAEGRLSGAEILSINGVDAASILASMLAVVHGDGDSPTAGPYQLSNRRGFARNLYLIAGLQSPFHLRYALAGKTAETVLNGLTLNTMPEIQAPPAGNATWRLQEGGSTGLLKVRSFGGKAEGDVPMRAFFEQVFTRIREQNVTRLILDLRDNGGGDDELGRSLFAYFADQPFLYYRDLIVNKLSFRFFQYVTDRDPLPPNVQDLVKPDSDRKYHMVGHSNWGMQQPAAPHYAGKTVVLMNGGSFSTTCEFLATLHHHGGAAFVGEETAGGYYGNTSGAAASLVLPNSKLILPVQLVGYYMAIEGNKHGARGIRPDFPVTYTIEDILSARDRAMETAL